MIFLNKKIVFFILFILFFVTIIPVYGSLPDSSSSVPYVTEKAKVLEIISDISAKDLANKQNLDLKQTLEVEILTGEYKGQALVLDNYLSNSIYYDIILKKGDTVTIAVGESTNEYELPEIFISGFERDKYELYVVLLFLLLIVVIGGIKGIKAIVALALSIILIIFFMLPMILKGYSPILLAVFTAIIATILTMFIIAGINVKSIAAIIGTAAGVMAAGCIAYIMGSLANLTGLSTQEANMLLYIPQKVTFDYKGLLFAGIIIGTLGAVMDIAMSISSSMFEIKDIEPNINTRDLISAGINIGKDVMGTMTNTLILAYTGTSIPLMLIFLAYDYPAIEILNMDQIATEIIRSFAGSIGLVLAIPFTAMASGTILIRSASKSRRERIKKLREDSSDDLKHMYSRSKDLEKQMETSPKVADDSSESLPPIKPKSHVSDMLQKHNDK